jgi:hypothetical protein
MLPLEVTAGVGWPNIELPGVVLVALPNLRGPGVVLGVVDSGLVWDPKIDCCGFACGVCSPDPSASISSSLEARGDTSAFLLAASRAEPNPLPNKEPPAPAEGFSLASLAEGSGLKELSNLKGSDANSPPEGFSLSSVFGAKGFGGFLSAFSEAPKIEVLGSALGDAKAFAAGLLTPPNRLDPVLFAADAKGLEDVLPPPPKILGWFLFSDEAKGLVALLLGAPNTLDPLLVPTEANPPLLAKPAKPPELGEDAAGAAAG